MTSYTSSHLTRDNYLTGKIHDAIHKKQDFLMSHNSVYVPRVIAGGYKAGQSYGYDGRRHIWVIIIIIFHNLRFLDYQIFRLSDYEIMRLWEYWVKYCICIVFRILEYSHEEFVYLVELFIFWIVLANCIKLSRKIIISSLL